MTDSNSFQTQPLISKREYKNLTNLKDLKNENSVQENPLNKQKNYEGFCVSMCIDRNIKPISNPLRKNDIVI